MVAYSFAAAPDVTAPAVSLTTPANGATVSATIPISATATDSVGVIGVQFRLDGLDFGPEVIAPPYTMLWNTAAGANGAHALTAVARDEAGNTATAAAVSVTVANVQTPIITWAAPQKIALGTAPLCRRKRKVKICFRDRLRKLTSRNLRAGTRRFHEGLVF